jgi:hypothetical protein
MQTAKTRYVPFHPRPSVQNSMCHLVFFSSSCFVLNRHVLFDSFRTTCFVYFHACIWIPVMLDSPLHPRLKRLNWGLVNVHASAFSPLSLPMHKLSDIDSIRPLAHLTEFS